MRITVKHLTADRLRELLHYDPLTGVFTWKMNRTRRAKAGSVAGSVNGRGYVQIRIDGVGYTASRLAYLYMQGEPAPANLEIDHRNHVKTDNRWSNLQPVTHGENMSNYHQFRRRRRVNPARKAKIQACITGNPLDAMRNLLNEGAINFEIAQHRQGTPGRHSVVGQSKSARCPGSHSCCNQSLHHPPLQG